MFRCRKWCATHPEYLAIVSEPGTVQKNVRQCSETIHGKVCKGHRPEQVCRLVQERITHGQLRNCFSWNTYSLTLSTDLEVQADLSQINVNSSKTRAMNVLLHMEEHVQITVRHNWFESAQSRIICFTQELRAYSIWMGMAPERQHSDCFHKSSISGLMWFGCTICMATI